MDKNGGELGVEKHSMDEMAANLTVTQQDLTKISVNKYDIESDVAAGRIPKLAQPQQRNAYLNYDLKELLELDIKEDEYPHWPVDGSFSRVNGLSSPRPCRQVALILWLLLSEAFSIYLFLRSHHLRENQVTTKELNQIHYSPSMKSNA